ncbi:monovalent cation/H+ antiporter complex subunit F [Kribbia dieselivorans]|uniref:monovalent cation/H+ antiporter complex subunit F n=1 Tax=Kribbia dieselivorans TaxID=331526 RepID=UPI0009F9031A|nr:monovalent cation/H+ antiporter complex subunit F [Kribbia dieselivorans]
MSEFLETARHITVWAVGIMLALDALLIIRRLIRGPSVLNRALASDLLVSTLICAIGAEMVLTGHSATLPLLASLALLSFVGTTAVARFVARDSDDDAKVRESRRQRAKRLRAAWQEHLEEDRHSGQEETQ